MKLPCISSFVLCIFLQTSEAIDYISYDPFNLFQPIYDQSNETYVHRINIQESTILCTKDLCTKPINKLPSSDLLIASIARLASSRVVIVHELKAF